MLLLLMLSVLAMPSVYATTTDDNKKEEPKKDEPTTKESEPAKEAEPEPKTPEPEATPSEELKAAGVTTTTTKQENKAVAADLPKCDGSAQDCITPNGDTCLKGQGGHECECADDMSDCPNHPSVIAKAAATSQDDIDPCLLDPSDPVCPEPDPDTQECPPGYAQNEDGNCFPLHPEGCPSGYHGHEDDETGRCIPNSTPCDPGYEFNDDHSNCEKEHFTCDGKPSVVPCKDRDDNNDNDHDHDHHTGDHNKDIIIKHITNKKVVEKIVESDNNLDIDQTIVAISYDEGKGLNCVIMEDNDGQCETFDVDVDKGKDPFLAVVQFD